MKKITLTGTPPSTQSVYKHRNAGRFMAVYMSNSGKDAKEQYQWEMKSQWKSLILEKDLQVDVTYYFKDKRRRDWDNFNKLWMDAGTGIIWVDDKQVSDAAVHKRIDKERPRTEILIFPNSEEDVT